MALFFAAQECRIDARLEAEVQRLRVEANTQLQLAVERQQAAFDRQLAAIRAELMAEVHEAKLAAAPQSHSLLAASCAAMWGWAKGWLGYQ